MPTPTNKCILSPQYYGTVYYYAIMSSCSKVVIDTDLRYDKRFKSVHRTTIVDTRGPLTLTVPVAKTTGCSKWSDMHVSSHGQWWADHRVSLESAYGRTPFFEFYIDRFLPWLSNTNESVTDFDCGIDKVLRRSIGIDAEVIYHLDDVDTEEFADYRKNVFPDVADIPYWQIRADRLGFVPGLSILDLLFNMGPETPLILSKMIRH